MSDKKDIGEYISESFSDTFITKFTEQLNTERMRQKIIAVFQEEIDKKLFIDKVKGYAAEEMDSRVFRNIKYWFIVVLTAFLTSAIGYLIAFLSKK